MTTRPRLYGLMAEFETAEQVLSATRRAWQAGYRNMDAYTPYPVDGLARELGEKQTRIPFVVLVGFIFLWKENLSLGQIRRQADAAKATAD